MVFQLYDSLIFIIFSDIQFEKELCIAVSVQHLPATDKYDLGPLII